MTADEQFQEFRRRIIGRTVTNRQLAGNSMSLWIDMVQKVQPVGWTVWLEPSWNVVGPDRVLAGSMQAQDEDQADGWPAVQMELDGLIGRTVEDLVVEPVTGDLHVTLSGGVHVRTFASDPRDTFHWRITHYPTHACVMGSPKEGLQLAELARVKRDPVTRDALEDYAEISSVVSVATTVDVEHLRAHHAVRVHPVEIPFTKNYDAIPGNHPIDWSTRFDTREWQLFTAWDGDTQLGAAIGIPGPLRDDGTREASELWDLRVRERWRHGRVGVALFLAVEQWAKGIGSPALRVETQQVNVTACRFYLRQGCTVESITPGAYPRLPDETRIVFRKTLG